VLEPCILFRPGLSEEAEEQVARQHFPVYHYRAEVPAGSLVVGRYSFLPFYNELEKDVELLGSRLINSFRQHQYVAQLEYAQELADVTFPTWFRYEDVPHAARNQPFVVKGRTNSRKFEWGSKMFAKDFQAAVRIGADLATDGLIGPQGVVLRQYVPLQTFEVGVTGTPITNEWRIFYYQGQRLAHGYYWGAVIDDYAPVTEATPDFEAHGLPFADAIALRLVDKVPFVVLDIAKDVRGRWWLVELNDGSQAGLNGTVDAQTLFSGLRQVLLAPGARR
jgi:hypothetical protein